MVPTISYIASKLAGSSVPEKFRCADYILYNFYRSSFPADPSPSNYRPSSTLHFIYKILEQVVMNHFQTHLSFNSLISPFQSAYHNFHSIESAIEFLLFKTLCSTDNYKVTAHALPAFTADELVYYPYLWSCTQYQLFFHNFALMCGSSQFHDWPSFAYNIKHITRIIIWLSFTMSFSSRWHSKFPFCFTVYQVFNLQSATPRVTSWHHHYLVHSQSRNGSWTDEEVICSVETGFMERMLPK